MSLHSLVDSAVAGRRILHRGTPVRAVGVAPVEPIGVAPVTPETNLLGRTSMRVLEAGLAATAIATALLLGIGR